MKKFNHIKINNYSNSRFTAPKAVVKKKPIPSLNPSLHGPKLTSELETAWISCSQDVTAYASTKEGYFLEFKGWPGIELKTQSLEDARKGIRLLNVREINGVTHAVVFVHKECRDFFLKKITEYSHELTKKGNPKHADLINSIQEISQALYFDSFWIGESQFKPSETPQWCEVWVWYTGVEFELTKIRFISILQQKKIPHKTDFIKFPERLVFLVFANAEKLQELTRSFGFISEFRKASSIRFFIDLKKNDQSDWVQDLIARINLTPNFKDTVISILDTGINGGHLLLQPILSQNDCLAVDPKWDKNDLIGHGTKMAGICGYGNLMEALEGRGTINLSHVLESIKILPDTGANREDLWGYITKQAISIAEINSSQRKRIICLAVTSDPYNELGHPSSWSGAIDNLCSGAEDEDKLKRLIIVSAGNSSYSTESKYPHETLLKTVEDPAQSWNSICVGAYTNLVAITDSSLKGYVPVAEAGGLSPFSSCSMEWGPWPIKPEVLMEGGNLAVDNLGFKTTCDDLSLLTTSSDPLNQQFDTFNMTSAATAQAAWFAARLQSYYPEYWPETIRALMIHSAEWTDTMMRQFIKKGDEKKKASYLKLLRSCGYGVPNLDRALHSANNSLTLISEAEIQPYRKLDGSYKTNEMHLYTLPWPKDELRRLPDKAKVKMRVTLSYFIEPGPGEIGWKNKYRYASFGLRFDVNNPLENADQFKKRINSFIDDNEESSNEKNSKSASDFWLLGGGSDKGSIHSDIWSGTAAQLADSNIIAVYPIIGWWRERANLKCFENKARYALIVTITTDDENVDIYTPVALKVGIPVTNLITIST